MRHLFAIFAFLAVNGFLLAGDGNRLSYLDSNEVWYPHKDFPKLITPQWVGEEGVECVVTFAIDDMRDPAKYEAYLRPILQRLKQIDGRAPVSIMTCNVKPDDPQLQTWLQEGLSLECHTADHPCPILAGGQGARAEGPGAEKGKNGDGTSPSPSPQPSALSRSKATYDKCVDLMASIPNNKPVAFRTPCCDSLNTVSPRLFSEIIKQTTPGGNFLQLDSSVFTLYTADDPSIPRELLVDPDGKEKFRKYIPRKLARGDLIHDGFVNTIENYPYPYVIQRLCWEFPCVVPSDWSANHLHKPNNPDTVRDLKAALDITVLKQGVFNLVFHPHGWIKAEQVVELIDHAVARHGKKVKFLTFKECVERLNTNVLDGRPLRDKQGNDNGVRLLDVDNDGFIDVLRTGDVTAHLRVWNVDRNQWKRAPEPFRGWKANQLQFAVMSPRGEASVFLKGFGSVWTTWPWPESSEHPLPDKKITASQYLDMDGDGSAEFIYSSWLKPANRAETMFVGHATKIGKNESWKLPAGCSLVSRTGGDEGVRFVDVNGDGCLDFVISNASRYGVWLFESVDKGWSIELLNINRDKKQPADLDLPPIVREDGSDNGFFVRDRHLCWINEDTDGLTDFVMRVAFDKLIGNRLPEAKSPGAAKQSMRVAPGYRVDLVAHEPLTMDPVAFDWGPDGKLWVAEMADYPNGIDGKGTPGGRIRFLEDTNGDGQYDKTTLFMDGVPFPNGVITWKKGVLVSAAPDIFYAEDTDGDGKADMKKVLFTGFSEGNQQHRANGFARGLDNWLYLANGDSGGTVTCVQALNDALVDSGSPLPARPGRGDKAKVDIRGRDIRIRPDTGEIEAVTGQTQFGRNRDDWGNWFGNNNSRPMYHYVLDDHYLRRNPHLAAPHPQKDVSVTPGAAPVFPSSRTLTRFNDFHTANRFTSACSSMVYRDEVLFGASRERRDERQETDGKATESGLALDSRLSTLDWAFISEPVHNLVHREIMRPDGLSFTSQRAINEEQSEFLSSTDNWFRPTQLKTGPDGALYVADMYRLVIEHPQWIPVEWQKKLDLRAGHDKGRIWRIAPVGTKLRPVPRLDKMTTAELVAALASPNGWQRDLAQQLLIDRADPAAAPLLRGMVLAPLARLHALCTLSGLNDGLTVSVVVAALNDPHAGVRRHAVRLCEHVDLPKADLMEPLAKLVDDADPQVRLQLAYTLGEIRHTRADELLGRMAVKANGDPILTAAVLSSLNADNLAAVLAEVTMAASDQTGLLQQLLGQAAAFKNDAAVVSILMRATEPSPDGTFARWQFSAIEQYAIAVERRGSAFHPLINADAARLPKRFEVLTTSARKIAQSAEASIADRAAAVRILGPSSDTPQDLTLLVELLAPQQPPEVQSAALTSLVRSKLPEIAKRLLAAYRSFAPGLRTQVSETLLSRETWRDELLAALESKQLAPTDIDATSRQRLLDHKSKGVRERAAKLLAIDLNTDRAKLVAEYLRTVRQGGDVQHGSQLFAKRCAQCHKLGNAGHAVGPDLASLTDKSPEAMLTAILDPNRAVETKFLTFAAITKAGTTHTGILASESGSSLTLLAAEGKETILLRSELDELVSTAKSLMPEGLEREVSPTDAAALIAYVRNNVPLPARKQFPGNEPSIVTADADGSITLTPFTAEIYGPTIVLEEKYKNLGWWSSADDIAVWTVNVPKAGQYAVSWTYACDPQAAGNRCVVEAAGKSFIHRVEKTANWDDYQTITLGEFELPAGEVRFTLKPASRPLPALGDVKSVVLQLKD